MMVDTLYDVWKLGERTLWLFSWLDGEPDHFSTVFAQNYLYLSPTCYGVLSSTVHVLLAAHSPYHPIPPPPPAAEEGPVVNVEWSVSPEVPAALPGGSALRSDDHGGGDH